LHFVKHQQYVPFGAQFGGGLNKLTALGSDAAFPLHRLQQQPRHGFLILRLFKRRDIAALNKNKPFGKGAKVLVKLFLPRGGKRGNRPAVETSLKRYDGMPSGAVFVKRIFPGNFAGPFVSLRAGITEKNFFHPRAGTGADKFFRKRNGRIA
jgi:hypothetical protein